MRKIRITIFTVLIAFIVSISTISTTYATQSPAIFFENEARTRIYAGFNARGGDVLFDGTNHDWEDLFLDIEAFYIAWDLRDFNFYIPRLDYELRVYENGVLIESNMNSNNLRVELFSATDLRINIGTVEHTLNPASSIVIYWAVSEPDLAPVIDGMTTFITPIDNPITEAEIRANITAFDETDGDLTHLIVLVENNYPILNLTPLGKFSLTYEVTDLSGNVATLTVIIFVVDVVAPIITGGQEEYTIGYKETLDIVAIQNSLTVTDNYQTTNIPTTIYRNTYSVNALNVGVYQIVFRAEDMFGNVGFKTKIINVIDNVVPVFSGSELITKPSTATLLLSDILAQITANDEIDGNLTSSIVVVSDNFTGNGNIVGTYTIELTVSDNAGNIAFHTVTVEVRDDLPPIFFVRNNFFISVSEMVLLTPQDVIDILIATGQITVAGTGGVTFTTLLNEYTGNEHIPGIYMLSFRSTSPSGDEDIHNVSIEVVAVSDDETVVVVEDETFIQKHQTMLIVGGAVLLLGAIVFSNSKPRKRRK